MTEGFLVLIIFVSVAIAILIAMHIATYIDHRKTSDVIMSFEDFHLYWNGVRDKFNLYYDFPRYTIENEYVRKTVDIGFSYADWIKYRLWYKVRKAQEKKEERLQNQIALNRAIRKDIMKLCKEAEEEKPEEKHTNPPRKSIDTKINQSQYMEMMLASRYLQIFNDLVKEDEQRDKKVH